MQKSCKQCGRSFEITDDDLAFYERISPVFAGKKELIPPPTFCPDCRFQRRCAWRNERKLYHRTCDLTQKDIVSAYAPDKPLMVYANEAWWSDAWDGLAFGRSHETSAPFFRQIEALLKETPHINLLNVNSENSAYTHNATYNKNCYMLFCGSFNEDCLHCYWIQNSTSCIDCTSVRRSERCYECNECFRCYDLAHSRNSSNCQASWYLAFCMNCSDCVGCVGLRNASHCWLNEQLSKEDYDEQLRKFLSSPSERSTLARAFERLLLTMPQPWSYQRMTEHCTGNYIYESQNCWDCFNTRQSQDCAHCQFIADVKESRDVTFFGLPGELLYEINNFGIGSYHCIFSNWGYGNREVFYCHNAHFCTSCFGCVNLHHKQYCILNKQYTKEEYERLLPKVIEHMMHTGEWGEYYPPEISAFGYNETMAQQFFPLTREEVLKRGWQWCDAEVKVEAQRSIPASQLPDDSRETPDDVLEWAILCEVTGKPFKIIRQELDFYRAQQLPLPRRHPDTRHLDRFAMKNPYKLWNRQCAKCQKPITTSYAPERPEIVYCENCYLKEIY